MGLINLESGPTAEPSESSQSPVRPRLPRIVPEFEADLGRLYIQMMDDPVPARLLSVLRAALSAPKSAPRS